MTPGVVGAAFLACLAGAVLPWISGEVVVVAAAAALPAGALPPLVAACVAGQMVGKLGLYAVVRWAPDRLPGRSRSLLERAATRAGGPRVLALAVFTGGAVAVPPFLLATLAAGALRLPVVPFLLSGLAGVLVRYSVLAWGAARIAGVHP